SHPVEGTYNVESKSSELGAITFVLVLKREGGKWMGEIKDSPMPLAISAVTVDEANKVTVTADAGGTPVTIEGKFTDGKIAGDWSAGDMKGTWTGARKDAVVAAAKPAAAAGGGAAAGIEGTYDFKIVADGQGELPLTLVIKKDGDKLVTENPGGGDLLVTGIELKDGDAVAFTATYQGNGPIPLPGKRTGNEMGGKWEFGGFSGTWKAVKK
ncbi:MAG: hypothetical protein SF339_21330, partial [Blastocatellia bacterium]|nr:hypothetical protein [Blastocatellia bacterium]